MEDKSNIVNARIDFKLLRFNSGTHKENEPRKTEPRKSQALTEIFRTWYGKIKRAEIIILIF